MRPYALLSLAALALAACSHAHDDASNGASASASPPPLRSCETRELKLDGADLIVQANIDGSPATIDVASAPDDGVRAKAAAEARAAFGEPRLDPRTTTKPNKWGIIQITDMCGHPVSAAPSPSPS